MGTEEHLAQRNSGHTGTLGTEEQWAQRKTRHRETLGTEDVALKINEQWKKED